MSDDLRLAFEDADAVPRRRRRWPWLVALLVVLLLVAVAFLAGEWVARDLVTKAVKQQVAARLDVPAGTEIDVDIPGSLLLQLATGRIDEATLSAPDIAIGELSGDVTVTVHDLGVWDGGSMSGGAATVVLDADQVRALMAMVDGFPVDSLGLAEPDVTVSTAISVLGASFPVGVALTPSADDGDLLLSPASLTLGGAQIGAAELRERFGALADEVLQDWRVCVAQYLPAGLGLTAVTVTGDTLVADFALDGGLLTDASLREKGTCD